MRPTLQAQALKGNLLQYLTTTFALADEGARQALEEFLGDEANGMFRGPFLRIRTPFTPAPPDALDRLGWAPPGFRPYAHQAAAFARLTSHEGHEPKPTVITTGTGSGKTEAFLLPLLDHCRRERAAGRAGVKAVLLYPMNALATDQAQRIDAVLARHPELAQVSAGLYIGDRPWQSYLRLSTRRSDMRRTPPDLLLTNYKMLDRLLMQEHDADLWRDADLRYVVVDEFHTYDGAQGSDVAMLLRRLAATVGASEPGRPLGRICPVATSATLADSGDEAGRQQLLDVASAVFGTPFGPDAVVGEQRVDVEVFAPAEDLADDLPDTDPEALAKLPDPTRSPEAFADLVEAVAGDRALAADPAALGAALRRHILTRALLLALNPATSARDGRPVSPDLLVKDPSELLPALWRMGASSWRWAILNRPEMAADALARFVAVLSVARDPDDPTRPLLHVEVHQWARAVSRLQRGVLPGGRAQFQWDLSDGAGNAFDPHRRSPSATMTAGASANLFLPAVYCRECGRSGWAAFSPESDDRALEFGARKIRRASISRDKIRVRNLIAATDEEAKAAVRTSVSAGSGGTLMVLEGVQGRLRPPTETDFARRPDGGGREPALPPTDTAFVLVNLGDTANKAANEDWCPACGEHNAIRYLGSGQAAITAAAITQLFTGGELPEGTTADGATATGTTTGTGRSAATWNRGERRTLMFNDAVQDAAHRAGFVANRSYTFSLRALLTAHLSAEQPTALHDLIADVVEATNDVRTLAAVIPPDLHDRGGVKRLLSPQSRGGDRRTWELIGERLAFATLGEFGFRSRQGRTLELTRTAAAHVHIPDPAAAAALVRAAHHDVPVRQQDLIADIPDATYLAFLRVFLERLRTRGAINHRWLDRYISEAGTSRYPIWGGRRVGMIPFPRGVAAPLFLLDRPKARSEFDAATGRLSWFERWAARCLRLPRGHVPALWLRLLPALVGDGLLSVRTALDHTTQVHGFQPAAIRARLLPDEQTATAFVRCPVCFWEQTVDPDLLAQWDDQPCPSYRCTTGRLIAGDRLRAEQPHRRERDYTRDYYRRLYLEAGTYQVITAEHTALLSREEREQVEHRFRDGTAFNDPNVLACTPTLELGIDIGELSAVVLASLPGNPASYAQRVGRAGRRSGNAYLLTVPGTRARDRYFLEAPKDMVAGRIIPPGCHLSAVEILRRQYLAFLLDQAAQGRLPLPDGGWLRPLPSKAPKLFGEDGYLTDLVDAALAQPDALADQFLALFCSAGKDSDDSTGAHSPECVSEHAAAELHAYASGGLRGAVEAAARRWHHRQQALRDRIKEIREAQATLLDADDEDARQKAELDGERRGVRRQLAAMGNADAQETLAAFGLLPNYALLDVATTLEATLYWRDTDVPTGSPPRYDSELREYARSRPYALREFAPGNTFYANGYRHKVTGIDIGSRDRAGWHTWRVCPGCGYVRTLDAVTDRSPCPRCRSTGIADDGSCLHHVVEPELVTSRDRREDARITDDRDDREQCYYEVVHAIDIPPETIERAWRHAGQTFGIDYSRRAMVRLVNLGPARFDTRPTDTFAGHDVRLNPFHVCTGCGAASTDGTPVHDHDPDGLSTSAARNPALRHHRPWCPRRRGRDADEIRVLLAHQLETEVLRVLLPAAISVARDRVHSLSAALRLGIDRQFGGDPAHLDMALAPMADQDTGEQRSYLVFYDSLPCGTGYLHRLTTPKAFRDVLSAARRALLGCPCATEDGRRACHRCLYRHIPDRFHPLVSRQEALDLIAALIGPITDEGKEEDTWRTEDVASTQAIGLDAQVESDLEARFLDLLRRWVAESSTASLTEEGLASGHLDLVSRDEVVKWRLTAQRQRGGSRDDFRFTRVDGPPQQVVVCLDGYRFHGTPEHNRLAHDAATRRALRHDGVVVFQVTWHDLDVFEGVAHPSAPVWQPYADREQAVAKTAFEQYGGDRADLADAVFVNPVVSLLAYLRRPDPELWSRRARALVTGLAARRPELVGGSDAPAVVAQLLREALAAGVAPPGAARGTGRFHVLAVRDATGLPLLLVMDAAKPTALEWTALAVLDDTGPDLGSEDHRLLWWAWLYWSNHLQFLDLAAGDGVQLAVSQIAGWPVETLAMCGGSGTDGAAPASLAEDELADRVAAQDGWRDARWDTDVLPLIDDEGELALLRLAEALADAGCTAPTYGHELGASAWLADFAWHHGGAKVAVVADPEGPDDVEAQRRDDAYRKAGWLVRSVSGWLAALDDLVAAVPHGPVETEQK